MNPLYKENSFSIYDYFIETKELFNSETFKISEISSVKANNFLKILKIKTKNNKTHSIVITNHDNYESTKDFLQGKIDVDEYKNSLSEPVVSKENQNNDVLANIIILIIIFTIIYFIGGWIFSPNKITDTDILDIKSELSGWGSGRWDSWDVKTEQRGTDDEVSNIEIHVKHTDIKPNKTAIVSYCRILDKIKPKYDINWGDEDKVFYYSMDGVILKLGTANEEYAKTMGKTAEELTAEERDEALKARIFSQEIPTAFNCH